LNYLNGKFDNNQWTKKIQIVLLDAITLSKNKGIEQAAMEGVKIVQRLENLLGKPPNQKHKEHYTFYKPMCREKQNLFTFLFIKDVPPDNNASERAIRNVKVKQKISGQFKTEKAVQNFAMIRSVVDTTIKNSMNVLEAMNLIAKLQPQIIN